MIDKNCHLIALEQVSKYPIGVRLRLSSLWSRWWMCHRDGMFGVRVSHRYGDCSSGRGSVREDFLTVESVIFRLGFRDYLNELFVGGAGLGCAPGSKKSTVLGELVSLIEEELE